MMKFKIISLLFVFFFLNVSGQTKNEKESRIPLEQFPEKAQSHIKNILENTKRIRHYEEIDGDFKSYESKFKYKKHWHSVEFDKDGKLEDIEVTVKERHLTKQTLNNITSYLKKRYEKFDFIKIQEQYLFDDSIGHTNFIYYILENRASTNSNYEIIIALKTDRNWSIKEMTFDSEGTFLNERTIQQDSYEYIMY